MTSNPSIAGAEHHHADLGDVQLHYVTMGDAHDQKEPVVLLHGWPQSWYAWRHILPELAKLTASLRLTFAAWVTRHARWTATIKKPLHMMCGACCMTILG